MCVAILSESGVGYPTKEIFERIWNGTHVEYANDDGAGYAYLTTDEKWVIRKGFMTLTDFNEAFDAEEFKPENTVIIHFRMGTSGKKIKQGQRQVCDPGCTHPFPVTDKREDFFELSISSETICMHNGVVGQGRGDLSDTMVAILDYVDPLTPYIGDPKVKKILTAALDADVSSRQYGSRWFVAKGAELYLLGNWLQDEETNIWYSKGGYHTEPEVPSSTYSGYRSDAYYEAMFGGNYDNQEETIIEQEPDLLAKDFLTKKLKVWSWVKWKRWEKSNEVSSSGKKTIGENGGDNLCEVYNSKNECIALVDTRTGETVWEVTPKTVEEKHCIDCGATIKRSASNDGLCPYCYAQLWPPTGLNDDDTPTVDADTEEIYCPECLEEQYVIDSTFDTHELECCRCGALWNHGDTIAGGFNQDTKAERDKVLRSLMTGTDDE
jgi:hypothetical protein